MPKEVIKRDGIKVPFDADKIKNSIAIAAKEGGLPEEKINAVVGRAMTAVMKAIGNKEEVATSEITENALKALDALEPSVSAAWRKYDQGKKSA